MNPPSSSASKPAAPRRGGRAGWLALAWLAVASASPDGLCPGELDRALETRQRILGEWPLRAVGDPATRFVQALGARLAADYGNRAGVISWRFALARNLAPNAFSIGAGYVFVTEGAVTFARNEEELAAILAHELGHELAGHFCPQPEAASGGFFDFLVGGDSPPPRPRGAGLGSLPQSVDIAKEMQADRIALAILKASGYDPRAMLEVARRLEAGGEGHWFDRRRVQSLERLLQGAPPAAAPRDSEPFQAIRQELAAEAPAAPSTQSKPGPSP